MDHKFMRYAASESEYPTGLQALSSRRIIWNGACIIRLALMEIPNQNGSMQFQRGVTFAGPTHGRAALLLVESLMHGLLQKGVISREEFIETVECAAEVERDPATANGSSSSDFDGSLLYPLAAAFRSELEG